MSGIKTKDITNKSVKQLDRVAIFSDHIRDHTAKTKEKVEKNTREERDSSTNYAIKEVEQTVSEKSAQAAHVSNQVRRKATKVTKENIEKKKAAVKSTINKTVKTAEPIEQSVKKANTKVVKGQSRVIKGIPRKASQKAKTVIKTTKVAPKVATNQTKKVATQTRTVAKVTAQSIKQSIIILTRALKHIATGTKAMVSALLAGGWASVIIILVCCIFGGAFYFFGDSSSSNYTAVSAEVEAYDPLIRQYAKEYGMDAYVELIKAVMMQESGGRGNDPMQASEGPYNTKYPKTPNGITSPDYSIQCGIQELKSCLDKAGCENPVDMERIRLGLQGYNYGHGYITWAINKDGGYTVANAIEFSDIQAEKLGWSSYGDKQYVAHVLRYYPYGNYNYGVGNGAIVQSALAEMGQVGGQPYWSWYGFTSRVEWCACFVSWNAEKLGYISSGIIPKFASCQMGANWFKEKGVWQGRSYVPSAGDIIFFDWNGDGHTEHVGIVEKCEGGMVYTVEGNSGDQVRKRMYVVGSGMVYGYGVPRY